MLISAASWHRFAGRPRVNKRYCNKLPKGASAAILAGTAGLRQLHAQIANIITANGAGKTGNGGRVNSGRKRQLFDGGRRGKGDIG